MSLAVTSILYIFVFFVFGTSYSDDGLTHFQCTPHKPSKDSNWLWKIQINTEEDPTGFIVSPRYPNKYERWHLWAFECIWTFVGRGITFDFDTFDVYRSSVGGECEDYVEITHDDGASDKMCGNKMGSKHGIFANPQVTFHIDSGLYNPDNKGFKIKFNDTSVTTTVSHTTAGQKEGNVSVTRIFDETTQEPVQLNSKPDQDEAKDEEEDDDYQESKNQFTVIWVLIVVIIVFTIVIIITITAITIMRRKKHGKTSSFMARPSYHKFRTSVTDGQCACQADQYLYDVIGDSVGVYDTADYDSSLKAIANTYEYVDLGLPKGQTANDDCNAASMIDNDLYGSKRYSSPPAADDLQQEVSYSYAVLPSGGEMLKRFLSAVDDPEQETSYNYTVLPSSKGMSQCNSPAVDDPEQETSYSYAVLPSSGQMSTNSRVSAQDNSMVENDLYQSL